MVEYDLESLFKEDSVKKNIFIPCNGYVLTNEDLVSEKLSLTERLCSASQLEFGGCEASEFKFTFRNNNMPSMVNKLLSDVYFVLEDNENKPFILGTYRVFSDKLSKDRKTREVVAYDLMYDITNADVSQWYKGLIFPMTIKDIRDSFFNMLGITQEETTLVNDNVYITGKVNEERTTGLSIIKSICEVNGVFGRMNRQNVFTYTSLSTYTGIRIFPSHNLYPSHDLYPTNGG